VDVFFTITALIGLAAQVFFGLRIRLLSGRWELAVVGWVLALAQTALSVVNVVTYNERSLQFFLMASLTRSIVISITVLTFIMDAVTAVALCYYMIRAEGRDSIGPGKYLLLLNESGMFAAVISLVALVSSIRSIENFIWLGLSFIRAKVVLNSVLVALNGRHLWRAGLPLVGAGKRSSSPLPQPRRGNQMQVLGIQVEHDRIRDSMSSMFDSEKHSVV